MSTHWLAGAVMVSAVIAVSGCDDWGNSPATRPSLVPTKGASPPTAYDKISRGCELQLELPAELKGNERLTRKITIHNRGTVDVVLVEPGDGSEVGWRTPLIGWSCLPADSTEEHPPVPPPLELFRCGNTNPLQRDEVFRLRPGESRELEGWAYFPYRLAPGEYRIVLYYTNVPGLECGGVPLGADDEYAVQWIKASTPIALISNEARLKVVE